MNISAILKEFDSINLIKYALYREYDRSEDLPPINLTQERVLLILLTNHTSSMQEVAHSVGLEKGPFSQIVNKLEKDGFLLKERSETDRRFIHLVLTDKGLKVATAIQGNMNEHFYDVLNKLSDSDIEAFLSSLKVLKDISNKILF